ncbi:MAG: type I restriction endonuclease subunit R [Candidatus Brocadiales bacterium]|nr:type I restriction endonuclease subunit R [Candidatus Brocadiales bacterium]
MKFNEDTRVKIPSILHLTRLGYKYLSLKDAVWNESSNIFTDIFEESVIKINPGIEEQDVSRVLEDVHLALENEDLGKAFYEKLVDQSGIKLIDFANFNNNTFNVVTELTYKNDDEEFRPDIILLINGMPLSFIEVKKPHNREGILAERNRINIRFKNKKFRRFVNITQFMVFSNNMEYDNNDPQPIQGAFYAAPLYDKPVFNYFREEEKLDLSALLKEEDDSVENFILKDNNLSVIKHNPEFITNKSPDTPTNRLSTSLFNKKRMAFILEYAIAYVKECGGLEKHIMRYPQLFATKAIEQKLDKGVRKGIIWHTQGSGKTALAFYNVKYLTDYFQARAIVPRFYFIVDRLDLLTQAHREFTSRGLIVHTVNTRNEFVEDLKKTSAFNNLSGSLEITVVNIHKFKDDTNVVSSSDYDIKIQRIYFLDEVHRSYNPEGSFLANLNQSDTNAIKIGLTGTPLLGDDYSSKKLFGDYIHKYYYNASIADGYTLRLIREGIETKYRIKLEQALREIEVLKGDIDRKTIYAHHKFVEPMLEYIVEDFERSRMAMNDSSIGGMIICDSSEQAKEMYEVFENNYAVPEETKEEEYEHELSMVASPSSSYVINAKNRNRVKRAALILHDIGTKEDRKTLVEEFKEGKIDFLIVYNMLLTGFDSKLLKKLYLGRVIKRHNLLQTLTRVNRPYKDFKYGYVVDFADIRSEFDATNKAYFEELQSELGDEMEHYSNLFKSREEIEEEIGRIKEVLFHFDTENAETFSQQITRIQDKEKVQAIKKTLGIAKGLYNVIRLLGHYDLLEKIDFRKLNILYREASNHLDMLNLKDRIENNADTSNILNIALEDVLFMFTKVSEDELVLADKLKNTLRKTREALAGNFDQKDPQFITLKEELERLFKKKNLNEITQDEMSANIESLNKIYEKIRELNRQNDLLKAKYHNDKKYARAHKRIIEKGDMPQRESCIYEALNGVKTSADDQVLQNTRILDNEGYFNSMMAGLVVDQFKNRQNIDLNAQTTKFINQLVAQEYIDEFHGAVA